MWNIKFPAKIIGLSSERVTHNCWFHKITFLNSAVVRDLLCYFQNGTFVFTACNPGRLLQYNCCETKLFLKLVTSKSWLRIDPFCRDRYRISLIKSFKNYCWIKDFYAFFLFQTSKLRKPISWNADCSNVLQCITSNQFLKNHISE